MAKKTRSIKHSFECVAVSANRETTTVVLKVENDGDVEVHGEATLTFPTVPFVAFHPGTFYDIIVRKSAAITTPDTEDADDETEDSEGE